MGLRFCSVCRGTCGRDQGTETDASPSDALDAYKLSHCTQLNNVGSAEPLCLLSACPTCQGMRN
jgi:hypothetical protein